MANSFFIRLVGMKRMMAASLGRSRILSTAFKIPAQATGSGSFLKNKSAPAHRSASANCRLLGARPSGRLGVSKPANLEYSAKAGERATSKRPERRAPLPTTWGCSRRIGAFPVSVRRDFGQPAWVELFLAAQSALRDCSPGGTGARRLLPQIQPGRTGLGRARTVVVLRG